MIESLRKQVSTLKEKLEAKEIELEQQNLDTQAEVDQAKAEAQEEVDRMKALMKEQVQAIKDLENSIADKDTELSKLQTQLDKPRSDSGSLEEKIRDLEQ